MEIINIFATELFAFRFQDTPDDEYDGAMTCWNDVVYLSEFYEYNSSFIKGNPFFSVSSMSDFVLFIKQQAKIFDKAITDACNDGDLLSKFSMLSKGKDLYEILPHVKSKQQVLRFYGIKLDDTILITGSAIKLTLNMDDHPGTARQKSKLRSCQDFLRDNGIVDQETLFDYLTQ